MLNEMHNKELHGRQKDAPMNSTLCFQNEKTIEYQGISYGVTHD